MYLSLAIQEKKRQVKLMLPLARASSVGYITFKIYLWKTSVYRFSPKSSSA